ncbi:MAG TPA: Ig-like domain-containing protein, partial [Candidatus Bathyarchaeia archaeon]|nr:Ig-like domain-containing protein [Candidatus Bathyarchaeia archaeon]
TARFAFTAPQTVVLEGTNVTITVRAFKDGFVEAQSQIILPVYPKTLDVQIIPDALTTNSGGKINVTVNVGYNGNPIENANVTTSSANGKFEPALGVTDKNGNVTFAFTAPEINQETNVNISVVAIKTGYIENTDELEITVKPRTFSISVNPSTVQSGRTETITIYVTCKEDLTATEAAVVTISFKNGEQITNITDSKGMCTFLAKIPDTSATTINLTVTATRIGYEDKEAEIVLNAVPAEGGFPWLLILMIVIPIAVTVLLIVLIRMKVMVVSTDEEQSSE